MRSLALAVLTVTLAASPPPPASAQARGAPAALLVEVTDAEFGGPLGGAFLTLLDADAGDAAVDHALADGAGRFRFALPAPGRYRVRAELIGRETAASEPVAVGAGETGRVALVLDRHAIALAEIRVEADQRCRMRSGEAAAIERVWDEARKALSVQTWTEAEALYRLDVSSWERDLDARGLTVLREDRRDASAVTRAPFASLPADELVRTGYVVAAEGGGHRYFGPDAGVLLSDAFLDGHCFRLERSAEQPGALGLAFEPVRGGDLADVEGTLWLDEETGGLRLLDFRFTRVPYREAEGLAGGRVEFRAMPDGAWIVDRWWIRAPILGRLPDVARSDDAGIRVTGIRESGGEVVGVSTLDDRRVSRRRRGTLEGAVWDSTRARPLSGARVYLSGTSYDGVTDADGRFRIEGLPAGAFTVAFEHPRLDSLGILSPASRAEIVVGRTAEVALAVPSTGAILLARCEAMEGEGDGAAISGMVRSRASGDPVPGATVRIEWQEVTRVRPVVQASARFLEVGTDAAGRYAACGLPLDEAVTVRASFLDHRGGPVEHGFDAPDHRVVDLEIDLPPGFFAARSDVTASLAASAVQDAQGAQGVQGVLRERGSGQPVRSAAVTVRHLPDGAPATALTDDEGFFRVRAPLPGPYVLSVDALGYGVLEGAPVEVTAGTLTVVEVEMVPEALELEPIVVTAEARSFRLDTEGFYERMEGGLGFHFTPEVMERRRPRRPTDLLFGLAGVNVAEAASGAGSRAFYFRSGVRPGGQICWPMVWVDRHLISTGGLGGDPSALDDFVFGGDMAAMEIYRAAAEIPAEFNGPNAGCGVIVVWTHRGPGP